jgi:hypothetical protein
MGLAQFRRPSLKTMVLFGNWMHQPDLRFLERALDLAPFVGGMVVAPRRDKSCDLLWIGRRGF